MAQIDYNEPKQRKYIIDIAIDINNLDSIQSDRQYMTYKLACQSSRVISCSYLEYN